MIRISIDPILVTIGPFSLSWHSLFVMLGMVVAIWLTSRLARQAQVNTIYSLATWVVLSKQEWNALVDKVKTGELKAL